MPKSSENLGEKPLLRTLVLATAKCGKTTTVVGTATRAIGPGYVICCSTEEHLRGAKNFGGGTAFDFDMCTNAATIDNVLRTARDGVKEGKYKWVLLDDFSIYAGVVCNEYEIAHKGNGMVFWAAYTNFMINQIRRMMDLKCHVFVTSHYQDTGAEIEGQVSKSGPGIVPAIQGARLRQELTGRFNQVIWMEKRKEGRVFRLSVQGVTGPGCNNLPDDVTDIPADVGKLLEVLSGDPELAKKAKVSL